MTSTSVGFTSFKFVVFDEVHHVMKKHPYRKLARLLELANPKPAILGLTATCTYAVDKSQIESDISKLCAALGIHLILTATTDELVRDGYHGATPQLELHTSGSKGDAGVLDGATVCDVFDTAPTKKDSKFMPHQGREAFFHSIRTRQADPLILLIMDLLLEVERLAAASTPSFSSPLHAKGKLGKVSAWSEYASKLKSPYANFLMHLYEGIRLLVVTWSAAIDLVAEYLRMTLLRADSTIHFANLGPVVQRIVDAAAYPPYNARFTRLEQTLTNQYVKHDKALRGILFVEQRMTTHILEHYINRTPSLRNFRTACIYATAGEASPAFRVTPAQSKQRVAQFAKGEVNLLISTAVAEEGMDVPAANCIIRFDPIHTPVSMIQGRGRARQEMSSFVVMEERRDRTVERLARAEHAQMSLLHTQSEDIVQAAMSEAAIRKKEQAQASRDRSALSFVQTASLEGRIPPVQIVKTFCAKTDREAVETFCKQRTMWVCSVAVHGVAGEKLQSQAEAQSKQAAKEDAYAQILEKIVTLLPSL
jgi:hypothetical protein